MAYSTFTDQEVFTDERANNLCNIIMQMFTDKFPGDVDTKLCLTGTVSKIIQSAPLEPVKVIPFITTSKDMFDYCKTTIAPYLKAKIVTYKDRIQITYQDIFVELWLTGSIGTIKTITDLKVQDFANIPPNIN
ncbi:MULTISPECIES: hypothetical protein [Flavobacteriaceae]|uniref:hypothetical protein n=1 Tax=Flavobacteriaceae TaxID=49546 RepID=UPI003A93F0AD